MSIRNKYIDLKINGKLFPTWILANFKKYKLPDLFIKEGEDPCNRAVKYELHMYQQFLMKYLDYRSPYKDILIYHGLGSGKTASAINIYNALYNYTSGWNVFLLIKASLHESTWLPELKRWLTKSDYEFRFKNIIFVHYDSPTASKQFLDAVKASDTSKKNLYIIDEAHNFIRNVYSNINTRQGRRAQEIYDYIIQDKKENEGVRVILLSGTPATNNVYELALLFNLLRPDTFPKTEAKFNQIFTLHGSINEATKNMFQRRIMGLVSYYVGATPDYYAKKNYFNIDVIMSDYQTLVYNYFEDIETKAAAKAKQRSGQTPQTYRSYTRAGCNFVFPDISQRITGELRPRPNKFRLTEMEAVLIDEGKNKLKLEKDSEKYMNVNAYVQQMNEFIDGFQQYLDDYSRRDRETGHTLNDDINTWHEKYHDNFTEFHEKENTKSQVYEVLYRCSAKYVTAIFNILKSPGIVLIYTNYVKMEGLQIFKIYLKCFGFSDYKDGGGKDKFRYTEYHGGIDRPERTANLEELKKKDNIHGDKIRIMMISPAGSEGIGALNVRQVHILEPYWHEARIIQMIGRAVRNCSHRDLPMNERFVDIYRYKSLKNDGKWTSDQTIEELAKNKDRLINSFLGAIKEVAVDCQLNYAHNKLQQDLKCFQFEEQSLFTKQIGPAYKKEIDDDVNINNGSNSSGSIIMKVKVLKISAVMQLSNEDDSKMKYSEPEIYWYNPETQIVYDYELHYPVGKIGVDDNEVAKKLDKDIYIIDQFIPIPMIESK